MDTLVINFKTYPHGTGKEAVKLARLCQSVARTYAHVDVILAVQTADIHAVSSEVGLPVIAQHVDGIEYGSHTGHTLVESVKANGAQGSLVNHSEHRLTPTEIKSIIQRLSAHKMASILCVRDEKEAKFYKKFKPTFIAVEPPQLIGGKKSISTSRPDLIVKTLSTLDRIPLLVGAGVHTTEDVRIARKLCANGILVASDILKAKNPKKELTKLLDGFLD